MDRFETSKCKADQGFMIRQVYALKLDRNELQILLEHVLPELEVGGFIDSDNGFFKLTEKGYDHLYINMRTEYEIADMIFDVCRKSALRSDQVVKWITVMEQLRKTLNPKELDLVWLVVDKLCKKEYIQLEPVTGGMPQWLKLLERGYDYMYDESGELDLSVPIRIIPEGTDILSDAAFNSMWEWVGEKNAPKYLTGTQLYNMVLKVEKNLPPDYNLFLNRRRDSEQSTTRKVWLYELLTTLSKEQRKQFFDLIESHVNRPEPETSEDPLGIPDNMLDIAWQSAAETTDNRRTTVPQPTVAEKIKPEPNTEPDKESHPSVFISYSWDSDSHKQWVLKLAERLSQDGIYVYLDQYDLRMGKDMTHFMENAIENADRILVVGTPTYKKRAIKREKGVGFEYSIMSSDMMNSLETTRFIPVLRVGPKEEAFPLLLQSRIGAFMDDDTQFEETYEALVREIYDEPKIKRPPLGPKPDFLLK